MTTHRNRESKSALVTGAGGFIGHHLVKYLKALGFFVRGVDIKNPEYEPTQADDFQLLDLRLSTMCLQAVTGMDHVYNLAADMGGIGYITGNHAELFRNNIRINVNMLDAAKQRNVQKFLFSSSACVYPSFLQDKPDVNGLKESDAIPADPEPGYGWEKLATEQLCRYYHQDHGMETRVVRFHNVYGPLGTYQGGREKAPAAICRKIALAKDHDTIDVWGDGKQTRSFMHVDDCVEGIVRLMASTYNEPLNLGTTELVTIDDLYDLVSRIAGKTIYLKHDLTKPQGVRGRNSDNTKLVEVLGWQPGIKLEDGLKETYEWICQHMEQVQVSKEKLLSYQQCMTEDLQRIRLFLKLKLRNVYLATGIRPSALSRYEKGEIKVPPIHRQKLRDYYRDKLKEVGAA